MADNINMTADEFCELWTQWCAGTRTHADVDLVQSILVNILIEFEKRGSVTHHRQLFGPGLSVIYTSPDSRKEMN